MVEGSHSEPRYGAQALPAMIAYLQGIGGTAPVPALPAAPVTDVPMAPATPAPQPVATAAP